MNMKRIDFFKNIGIKSDIFNGSIKADLYRKAEDFVVEEIFPDYVCSAKKEKLKYSFNNSKKYYHAVLVKKNISTFEAAALIAKGNELAFKNISYCGLKDTLGVTSQRICIKNKGKLKQVCFRVFFEKNYGLL